MNPSTIISKGSTGRSDRSRDYDLNADYLYDCIMRVHVDTNFSIRSVDDLVRAIHRQSVNDAKLLDAADSQTNDSKNSIQSQMVKLYERKPYDEVTDWNAEIIDRYKQVAEMMYKYFDLAKENETNVSRSVARLQIENEDLWMQLKALRQVERLERRVKSRHLCNAKFQAPKSGNVDDGRPTDGSKSQST